MAVTKVEICANCGSVAKRESKKFKCPKCSSEVCVVVSKEVFEHLVKEGLAKEE
jgi:Zn finger protein HypA/HybF involved in hydrogenase expression